MTSPAASSDTTQSLPHEFSSSVNLTTNNNDTDATPTPTVTPTVTVTSIPTSATLSATASDGPRKRAAVSNPPTLRTDNLAPEDESEKKSRFTPSGMKQMWREKKEKKRRQNPSFREMVRTLTEVNTFPKDKEPTIKESLKAIVTMSWLNFLLVFVPISWALHFAFESTKSGDSGYVGKNVAVFTTAFLAIVPLAKLLGYGTEELSLRVGQTLGGLMNATLGNAVELIIAILALVKCELQVVQSSLLGSILSNLLLVLGTTFFLGGLRFAEQGFKETASQLNTSLLIMAVVAVLIPAGFHAAFSDLPDEKERSDILKFSRGISVILLVVYAAYLIFQLWSHAYLYADHTDEPTTDAQKIKRWGSHRMFRSARSLAARGGGLKVDEQPSTLERGDDEDEEEEEEREEVPTLDWKVAVVMLVLVTVLVGVTSEWLVDSINGVTSTGVISEQWVGLILLPIVGNAAEHLTAVTVGMHDKLDLSISVAVGSSIQISLFVIPLLVVLGWIIGKPLSLLFDPFESIVLFLSVLIVGYATQDGKSNWLEGFLLINVYVIVAVAFWFYPGAETVEAVFNSCTTLSS